MIFLSGKLMNIAARPCMSTDFHHNCLYNDKLLQVVVGEKNKEEEEKLIVLNWRT